MQPKLKAISPSETLQPWLAELGLAFTRFGGRTVLAKKQHNGPLVLQKALYPEGLGVCHGIIVHPPGGVAGGDQLRLNAVLDAGAHALLTTPGAGKWYKANGRQSSQHNTFTVEQDSLLEWLPQETIIFDAAQSLLATQVELSEQARYAGWEILCLGRQASGEKFVQGRLQQRLQIRRSGKLLWSEFADLHGGDALLDSPIGMQGCTVTATFVVAAGTAPAEVLEACRAVVPAGNAACGVSALPEIFVARYLGNHALQAREYFEALWAILRPWYAGQAASRPRIWNT